MLNLEPSLYVLENYSQFGNTSKNTLDLFVFFRGIQSFFPNKFFQNLIISVINTFTLLEAFRQQIPEINLLQLVPGLYLFFFFGTLFFQFFGSTLGFLIVLINDEKKELGSKTKNRLQSFLGLKVNYLFLFFSFFLIVNLFFPLSLDSFSSYGENNLENIWSLDEVFSLELWFFYFFLFFSQISLNISSFLSSQEYLQLFPFFWRFLLFFLFIFSGFFTPTLDALTQIEFSLIGLGLSLAFLQTLQNRFHFNYFGITTNAS